MNQTFGSLPGSDRVTHWGDGNVNRDVLLGQEKGVPRKLMLQPYGTSLNVMNMLNISLTKAEAIQAAEEILTYYKVPFCNRVKNG